MKKWNELVEFKVIDSASLQKHFDSKVAEENWDLYWSSNGVNHYEPETPREKTFVVDTPPPTVSGSLHVGHVFSYTHTDLLVRYQRMQGKNIFYPIGWDDNGLPTERRVQNYFHVRCSLDVPFDPQFNPSHFQPGRSSDPPAIISRQNFIQLCLHLTQEDEKAFKQLWQRIGLSVDWRQEYSTIDDHSRHISQLSFLDLYRKGHVYSVEAPTMWDVDFQTAVAQAEIEDRDTAGSYHRIRFQMEETGEAIIIDTSRPELLPACVAMAAHPEDARYKHMFGKHAITPLFQARVPIVSSSLADPEKGTGIMMVCTFGDANDVEIWRDQRLPLKQVLTREGRMAEIQFGSGVWNSNHPETANAHYKELVRKPARSARKAIAVLLSQDGSLLEEPKPVQHPVKYYEKGDRPLEIIATRQWFVRLMDKKEELIGRGDSIRWYPDHMRLRFRNWTENLQLDWCISRQRYFGVPIPVWYPLDEEGNPKLDDPIIATEEMLPVDPVSTPPPGFTEEARGKANGFKADEDVFDTWFTSSMTPQIASRWTFEPRRHASLFPMDVRPQSHEIIRTWAFYTIAKAHLHENSIPWSHVTISGWVLDPDRKKMSKSRGNVITPIHLIDQYGADAVRYWSAGARLGTDTAFDEKVIKTGRRLVTKIFNASKFVLTMKGNPSSVQNPLDQAFLRKLVETVAKATEAFEAYEHDSALSATERFFWNYFTDSYIELVKRRAYSEDDPSGRDSAVTGLRTGLHVLLRLFAPFLPYITEEVWAWAFAEESGCESIHRAPWPQENEMDMSGFDADPEVFEVAVASLRAINKAKTEASASLAKPVERVTLIMNSDTTRKFQVIAPDVLAATQVRNHQLVERSELEDNIVEASDMQLATE